MKPNKPEDKNDHDEVATILRSFVAGAMFAIAVAWLFNLLDLF